MIRNHEEDEFVAVRVQDPRIQNEASWNSYVDYKIFLHTNSKAFTAKTSCVRRRYSEFAWLKKKLQKNAGLVPIPDLPGKSFFSFCNEDFLERRRKGLQVFLDKVVHMTVCLSDSQLHLFLQTQLPVGHIQDCIQGHTPYSVTDAILTYASSNQGLVQAQEDDSIKEPSLTISYESMESPAPHQPYLQTKGTFSPELLPCGDPDPLEDLLELCVDNRVGLQHKEKSSVRSSKKDNHLEAVAECDCGLSNVTFFLGDDQDEPESLSLAEQNQKMSCRIQTPVEVHSPMEEKESIMTLDTEEKTVAQSEGNQLDSPGEAKTEKVICEPGKCVNAVATLDFKDNDSEEQVVESEARSQEEFLEGCSERQVLENHVITEVNCRKNVDSSKGHMADVKSLKDPEISDRQRQPDSDECGSTEETPLQSQVHDETHNMKNVSGVESSGNDTVQEMAQEQEMDLVGTIDESNEDSQPLLSSGESIIKVSDEERISVEIQAPNGYVQTSPVEGEPWSDVEASRGNTVDLQMNGCPVENDNSAYEEEEEEEEEDPSYMTSLKLNSTVAGGDLTASSDFLESKYVPPPKCAERESLSSLSLDASEETHEVEVH
nr:sorting nexin-11 [Monopterus albus]XP_020460376.1 sorting nexin-11 [Monopterus albus]